MDNLEQALYHVYQAAMWAAPSEDVKRRFRKYDMELSGELGGDRTHLRMLIGALYDGLAYGNWPYTPSPEEVS